LPIAGQTRFILVARDTSFAGKVKAILKGTDPAGAILRRFEIKLITDFMNT